VASTIMERPGRKWSGILKCAKKINRVCKLDLRMGVKQNQSGKRKKGGRRCAKNDEVARKGTKKKTGQPQKLPQGRKPVEGI